MNKKRFFIMCALILLCTLTISTKVKAIQYTDEMQYTESKMILASKIRDNTVNRNKSFSVLAKITYDKPVDIDILNNYADNLVKLAMSEELANSSSAGDYLKYSWDEYKKNISGYYSSSYSKYNYYLTITYKFTYYTTYNQEQKLNKDVLAYISKNVNKNDTDLSKISMIYNYISKSVKYNKNIGDIKYSAYSAYENKTAICQGYSTLLYKMLKEADIDEVRVIRSATHSWNIVKIGNKYYHLDTTWEATTSKKGNYNYFLKGSNEINKLNQHKIDSEYKTKKFKKEYPISNEDYMKTSITKIKNVKNKKAKINWKENIYCDGYVIEYSTKKNFKNSKKNIISNRYTSKKTIKGLKKNTKYYVRIRTYKKINNKRNYFTWSNTRIIKTTK